jgi:hypothetical protein
LAQPRLHELRGYQGLTKSHSNTLQALKTEPLKRALQPDSDDLEISALYIGSVLTQWLVYGFVTPLWMIRH